jgi:AAA+ superfamily predicted ATPase
VQPFSTAAAHLIAELTRLELMIRRHVLKLRAQGLITDDDFRGLYIPDEHVDRLLRPNFNQNDVDGVAALSGRIATIRGENLAKAAPHLPLLRLISLFGLSDFEADVLLIAAAPELDVRYQTLFSYAQNDVTRKRPTVDFALKLLCATMEQSFERRRSFDARAPLLRSRLLSLIDDPQDREPPLASRYLAADPRIVAFLTGDSGIDERLAPVAEEISSGPGWGDLVFNTELHRQLALIEPSAPEAVLLFEGARGTGRRSAARLLAASLEMPLLAIDMRRFTQPPELLRREALLRNACLYLDCWESYTPSDIQPAQLVARLLIPGRPLFLGSTMPWNPNEPRCSYTVRHLHFAMPPVSDRAAMWRKSLNGHRDSVDIGDLAAKFALTPGQISRTARDAARSGEPLHAAAQICAGASLGTFARKVKCVYQWSDLVLPNKPLQQLRETLWSIRHREVVYGRWQFEGKLALGRGVNILFSGQSGTGKTMAASILAQELALDLYKIDLASVVSKYIGETEKNLSAVFRDAQSANCVLFFDEADALFGKRSEVKDAHDRYANLEVAWLLQRMEEYEGIVILATNFVKNLDDAFARRMHHAVEFPFPDTAHRERIWRSAFPAGAPLDDDIDFAFLARQFDLAGGNIRNVALAAAFLAAEQGGRIRMEHLVLSVGRELQKVGKLPSQTEFRQYYELIRQRC